MPNPVLGRDRPVVFVLFLVMTIVVSPLFALPAAPAAAQSALTNGLFFFRSAQDGYKISLVSQARIRKDNDVAPADDVLRLTNESAQQTGAAWYTQQVAITDGFETVFDVRMTNNAGIPADGFSFVIHNDSRGTGAVGNSGGAGGYAGASKITNSVAIEFDTFQNTEFAEPNYSHIALLPNGNQLPTLNAVKPPINLVDKRAHTVKIRYLVDPEPLLEVYWDNMINPLLRQAVNVSSYAGDQAWVGFVASTGTYDEIIDIRNWYFRTGRNLNCGLEYDFTSGDDKSHGFNPDGSENRGGANWPGATHGEGWRGEGSLAITRGFGMGGGFIGKDDGLNPTLYDLVSRDENPLPIEQIKLTYTLNATNNTAPASAGTLTAEYAMGLQGDGPPIIGTADLIGTSVYEAGESRLVSLIDLAPEDVARAIKPDEFRIWLKSSNPADVIRLKALAVCIALPDSSRPPVIPFGAAKACADLLTNIKSRWQPFGPGTPLQREHSLALPPYLTLEPYPEYSLDAPGYPAWMTYDTRSWANILPGGATPPKLVPCVFAIDGQFYNPQPLPKPPTDDTPPSRNQIVRFTAVEGTPDTRQMLVLLNYAAYFSVGSGTWCYASDNVFAAWGKRDDPDNYGPGYNVPSPVYDCGTLAKYTGGAGPCGSFVGSLFRGMGYFDVDAIAAAYKPDDPLSMGGLYYGVDAYIDALPGNTYGSIQSPLILRDPNYRRIPITFAGIRTYPYEGDPEAGQPLQHSYGLTFRGDAISPVKCQLLQEICWSVKGCQDESKNYLNCEADAGLCIQKICDPASKAPESCARARDQEALDACARTRDLVEGHSQKETHNVLSPLNRNGSNVQSIWEQIKPGDIAITVIETAEYAGDVPLLETVDPLNMVVYPHIQVVVGWGPKVSEPGYVRDGTDLYPTFASLPEEGREKFVPYVMDRFSLPGTGGTTGPRPFSFGLWHTATDFWVSSPAQ